MLEALMFIFGLVSTLVVVFVVLCFFLRAVSFNIAKGWYTGKKEALIQEDLDEIQEDTTSMAKKLEELGK